MGDKMIEPTVDELVRAGSTRLMGSAIDDAEVEAEVILRSVLLDVSDAQWCQARANADDVERYFRLIDRRISYEPLEYLVGYAQFRRVRPAVGHGVYVPKRETSALIDIALTQLRHTQSQDPTVPLLGVDLCTGSGAIALSLGVELANVSCSLLRLTRSPLSGHSATSWITPTSSRQTIPPSRCSCATP